MTKAGNDWKSKRAGRRATEEQRRGISNTVIRTSCVICGTEYLDSGVGMLPPVGVLPPVGFWPRDPVTNQPTCAVLLPLATCCPVPHGVEELL